MTGDSTCVMHAGAGHRADFVARAQALFGEHGGCDDERRLAPADGAVFGERLRGRTVQPREPSHSAGTVRITDDISNSREEPPQPTWAAEHHAPTVLVNRAGFGSPRRARAR
jgi:hypothetical protein